MSQSIEELKEREELQREMRARNKARRAVEKEQREIIQKMDVDGQTKAFFRKNIDRFFYCPGAVDKESVEIKNDKPGCLVASSDDDYTCDSCEFKIHRFRDFADIDLQAANLKCFELDQPLFEEKITHATLLMPVLRRVQEVDFDGGYEPINLRASMENKDNITRRDFYLAMQTILKTRLDDPQVNECVQILEPYLECFVTNELNVKEPEEGQAKPEIAQFQDKEGQPLERLVDIGFNGRYFPEVIRAFDLHGEVFVVIDHGT